MTGSGGFAAALATTAPLMLLVVGAACAWPAASSPKRARRPARTGLVGPERAGGARARHHRGATAHEVADALTLLALTLRGGCGPVEALEAVAGRVDGAVRDQLCIVAAAHRWGVEPAAAWAMVPGVWRPAAVAWQAALTAGASPAELVLRAAEAVRDDEDARVEAAVSRAGVLLVLPLGLAFLPGFVATTVVPVVAHLVSTYAGATTR